MGVDDLRDGIAWYRRLIEQLLSTKTESELVPLV
jgi:hypothetical protein